MALINSNGDVLYHKDPDMVGTNIKDEYGDVLEQKIDFYYYQKNNEKMISYLAYNEILDLIMWAIVPAKEVSKVANQIMQTLSFIIFGVGVLIVFVAIFFANSISIPIKAIAKDITHISTNLDFTNLNLATYSERKDELGELALSFTRLINTWIDVVSQVKQVAVNLLESSSQLADASEDSTAASRKFLLLLKK